MNWLIDILLKEDYKDLQSYNKYHLINLEEDYNVDYPRLPKYKGRLSEDNLEEYNTQIDSMIKRYSSKRMEKDDINLLKTVCTKFKFEDTDQSSQGENHQENHQRRAKSLFPLQQISVDDDSEDEKSDGASSPSKSFDKQQLSSGLIQRKPHITRNPAGHQIGSNEHSVRNDHRNPGLVSEETEHDKLSKSMGLHVGSQSDGSSSSNNSESSEPESK